MKNKKILERNKKVAESMERSLKAELELHKQKHISFMTQVQFIQVSPQELATLIQESVKQSLPNPPLPTIEPKQKEILTRIETANLFSISLVCLHDWVKKNILKPYKVGNKTYFKRSEVLEVLSSSNKQN